VVSYCKVKSDLPPVQSAGRRLSHNGSSIVVDNEHALFVGEGSSQTSPVHAVSVFRVRRNSQVSEVTLSHSHTGVGRNSSQMGGTFLSTETHFVSCKQLINEAGGRAAVVHITTV